MSERPPFTREDLRSALGELYDIFSEWRGLIECEEDANGFPAGDSLEANMQRLISEVTSRTSGMMFALLIRGMQAEPPIPFEELSCGPPA